MHAYQTNDNMDDEVFMIEKNQYIEFIHANRNKNIIFLELGVGWNTPEIIKYPFMQMTHQFPYAKLCVSIKRRIEFPKKLKKSDVYKGKYTKYIV